MRTYFFTLVLSLVLSQVIFAQTRQQVININKAKKEIKNNVGRFHKIEELKDSTGYRYVYKNGKELTLIAVYNKDQNIDKHVEWYFLNGQMIYAEQTWTDNKTKKLIDNEKSYFSAGHLIYLIGNNKTVDSTSKEFKDADRVIVAYGAKLEALYANKKTPNTPYYTFIFYPNSYLT